MKTSIRIIAMVLLGAAAPSLAASLTPYTAHYGVTTHGIGVGVAQFELTPMKDAHWKFSSESHTTGVVSLFRSDKIRQSSTFDVAKDGSLRARSYRYAYAGDDDRDQHIVFEWADNIAHDYYRGDTVSIRIPDGASDPFLAQLKLSKRVAHGMVKGLFPVVNRNKLEIYHLKVVGTGNIKVPAGKFRVVRVERNDPGSSRKTVFWLAPDLHYVPVKVQQLKNDKAVFRLALKSIRFHR